MSNRNNQVARIYIELQALQNSRGGLSTKDIHTLVKDRFRVSMRTVYRDLMALEDAGFPLVPVENDSPAQTGVRWQLMNNKQLKLARKVVLNENEMRTLQNVVMSHGGNYPGMTELLDRIKNVLSLLSGSVCSVKT